MRQGGGWAHPPSLAPPPPQHRGPLGWKSPVPYLFGGLTAMMGLIAFALVILACSYWKMSGHHDDHDSGDSAGIKTAENGEKEMMDSVGGHSVLVIMAGDEKPTFLATLANNIMFGDNESNSGRKEW